MSAICYDAHLIMEPKVNIALEAARAGCKELLSYAYRLDQLEIKEKGPSNFVTQLDRKVESIIIDSLKSIYPKHTYVSEEVGRIEGSGKDIESMWIIDPLDGTTNFIHGFPYYAISIAYVEKGKTLHALIIDVSKQDEFTASLGRGAYLNNRRIRVSKAKGLSGTLLSNSSHDTDKGKVRHDNMSTFRSLYSNGLTIRRTGSAALDMANVAAGRLDGFWGSGLGMWDIAAGGLLVREAGGLVSDYFGNPDYLAGDNIICSTNKCFKPMLQSIKPYTSIVES
ncbi:MAG: inositol monophosphatase family protein [Pseudomonadota bacterium]|nr:inositol monophosphatase family protein [Pseudomonadota bacterium]